FAWGRGFGRTGRDGRGLFREPVGVVQRCLSALRCRAGRIRRAIPIARLACGSNRFGDRPRPGGRVIGQLFGARYEILQDLEPSPLFQSYRAIDRQSGREVRLRILDDTYMSERKFVESIKTHVEQLSQISHPAIEKFLDSFEEDDRLVLVSEYVACVPLDER